MLHNERTKLALAEVQKILNKETKEQRALSPPPSPIISPSSPVLHSSKETIQNEYKPPNETKVDVSKEGRFPKKEISSQHKLSQMKENESMRMIKRKRKNRDFEVSTSQDIFDFNNHHRPKMSTVKQPIEQKRRKIYRDPKRVNW